MRGSSIWSLHDVSVDTFDRAARIVERLSAAGVQPLCILIIPSGDWDARQLESLRQWQRDGHMLAGHGWDHRSPPARSFYHRLHSLVLSRNAAEHLAQTEGEIRERVERGVRWFADAGLAPPRLYVPPAWAPGALPLSAFRHTPYRWVETLTGLYSVDADRFTRLPLVGFEADTWFRAISLRALNGLNRRLAELSNRPLRVAVHPHDFDLFLSEDLRRLLAESHRVVPLGSAAERLVRATP